MFDEVAFDQRMAKIKGKLNSFAQDFDTVMKQSTQVELVGLLDLRLVYPNDGPLGELPHLEGSLAKALDALVKAISKLQSLQIDYDFAQDNLNIISSFFCNPEDHQARFFELKKEHDEGRAHLAIISSILDRVAQIDKQMASLLAKRERLVASVNLEEREVGHLKIHLPKVHSEASRVVDQYEIMANQCAS